MVWRPIIVMVTATMLAFSVHAAGEWERLAPGDAKISVNLDWTPPERGYHANRWAENYGNRIWVSAWSKHSSGYPRLEISVIEAGPGYHIRGVSKVSKKSLKDWNFFKDTKITLGKRSSTAGFKTVYFNADDTSCIHFMRSGPASGVSDIATSSSISSFVAGFYCPEKASVLSDGEAATVLGAIRFGK